MLLVTLVVAAFPTLGRSLTAECTFYGDLARTVMEKRQKGVDMSVLMAIVEKQATGQFKSLARRIVIAAYAKPLFSLEKNKQQTISEFANEIQVRCYQTSTVE
ncbi:hypothetical protein ACWGTI_03485 [Mesorhizobium sp. ArgA1]